MERCKKVTITKDDLEKIIPPKDKKEAIAQSEKYSEEFEKSREQVNQILDELQKMFAELEKSDER